jgi:hypothetical protein
VLLYVFSLCCAMYCLCVIVYCHRVTTQLQLINIIIIIIIITKFIFGGQRRSAQRITAFYRDYHSTASWTTRSTWPRVAGLVRHVDRTLQNVRFFGTPEICPSEYEVRQVTKSWPRSLPLVWYLETFHSAGFLETSHFDSGSHQHHFELRRAFAGHVGTFGCMSVTVRFFKKSQCFPKSRSRSADTGRL